MVLVAVAAAFGLTTWGGAAFASIPDSGTGVYTVCMPNTGTLRTALFIDKQAGTTCPANYTEKTWNHTGPAGPAGPVGAVGATGAKGDPGATGPAGTTGPTGPAGSKGDTGSAGVAGPVGPAGPAGADGAKGDTGAVGPAGTSGRFLDVGSAEAVAGGGSFETASLVCPLPTDVIVSGGLVIDQSQTVPHDYSVVLSKPAAPDDSGQAHQWWIRIAVPVGSPDVHFEVDGICFRANPS